MSLVLAADYSVTDFEPWWASVSQDLPALVHLGARHVVVYRSIADPDRIFITIGVHGRPSVSGLLRSAAVFRWFDAAGVDEIPPLFAGQLVEKFALVDDPADTFTDSTAVLVAGIVPVADFDRFWARVHADRALIAGAGVTHYWAYRALDDANEIMFLQKIDTEEKARLWIKHADAVAEWMTHAGVGVYPSLFVGRLVQIFNMTTAADD